VMSANDDVVRREREANDAALRLRSARKRKAWCLRSARAERDIMLDAARKLTVGKSHLMAVIRGWYKSRILDIDAAWGPL
jgi:hypothetical protein